VVLGVLGGSAGGTQVAKRLHSNQLIKLFAILMAVAAVQMMYRGAKGLGQ
jgi:uncharacterized membrane protein YfcA